MKKTLVALLAFVLVGCGVAGHNSVAPSPSGPKGPNPTTTMTPTSQGIVPEPTSQWEIGNEAGETELAGYTDKVSVPAGEPFGLYVSSELGDVKVTAYRIGHYDGKGGGKVWDGPSFPGVKQAAPEIDGNRTVVAKWKKSIDVETTGWPAGAYLLKLVAGGKAKYVPMLIRSTDFTGKLIIASAVTTFQAYNKWGGYSLYLGKSGFGDRAYKVSFDRPYDGYGGAGQFFGHEIRPIRFIEKLGLDLAYVTSLELHQNPEMLKGAAGLVSLGHDEYWTVAMRDNVESARDQGLNVVFLGANVAYWRIRFEEGYLGKNRTMVGYKSATADEKKGQPDTTALWRANPHPRPENSLTGMLYECFPADAPLVVETPDFFAFAGTGVKKGTTIPKVLRIEVDRAYPIAGTPSSLQVVSHSPLQCGKNKTFSDMTYYTTESGAGVFATGNMNWTKLLDYDPKDAVTHDFAFKVTENIVRSAAQPLMGKQHPAQPNLSALKVSAATSNGTGGAVGG